MELTDEQIRKALDDAFIKCGDNAYFGNGFRMGIKFALEQMEQVKKLNIDDVSKCYCNCDSPKVYYCKIQGIDVCEECHKENIG